MFESLNLSMKILPLGFYDSTSDVIACMCLHTALISFIGSFLTPEDEGFDFWCIQGLSVVWDLAVTREECVNGRLDSGVVFTL